MKANTHMNAKAFSFFKANPVFSTRDAYTKLYFKHSEKFVVTQDVATFQWEAIDTLLSGKSAVVYYETMTGKTLVVTVCQKMSSYV